MYNEDVPVDRDHDPKASTVGVSTGNNYTGHFTEVQNDNSYYYHHQE